MSKAEGKVLSVRTFKKGLDELEYKILRRKIKQLGYKIVRVRHRWVLLSATNEKLAESGYGIFESYAVKDFSKRVGVEACDYPWVLK